MFEIFDIIKPLLKQGQSIYQILKNHPEINLCAKTLYMYIASGIFKDYEINTSTGEIRGNIFYCDPQTPSQKPNIENNHNYVRDIIPNKKSLKNLTQKDINLMFSHINSTPRAALNGKTPYEAFEFLYSKEILNKLNVQKIEKDMVTLQPYLLNIT